jgi:hypothetical protein
VFPNPDVLSACSQAWWFSNFKVFSDKMELTMKKEKIDKHGK